ncbi:putative Rhodanese domain-containing protein [Candidatus Hydrogenisulfobacillus filiaventi]|uniref:Putative Rhodanese domain-containing protein n=1 Tax=Candidatus Hydrogenisulfobacillus filiaventi TaxID=2707344 RepID=A0A6F8ZDJ4_9FIRM|nr:putative Rhodanese domain-containing protein [Candidatus Hydrogenisulfobacillus filiaventi]
MAVYPVELAPAVAEQVEALAAARGQRPEAVLALAATVYTTLLTTVQVPGVVFLTPGELAERLARGWAPTMVDVDQPAEYAALHLVGSRNLPLTELLVRQQELADAGDLLLLCKAGIRSGLAAAQLSCQRGRLFVLAGGLAAWMAEGRPLGRD